MAALKVVWLKKNPIMIAEPTVESRVTEAEDMCDRRLRLISIGSKISNLDGLSNRFSMVLIFVVVVKGGIQL